MIEDNNMIKIHWKLCSILDEELNAHDNIKEENIKIEYNENMIG